MSKYSFTDAQRFAVWTFHDQKCYLCDKPLRLQDVTVDHVIPEYLVEKPEELARVKTLYQLPEEFEINDYCNWLPCHSKCNQRKSKSQLPSMLLSIILQRLIRDADDVKRIERKIIKDSEADKVLARVMVALESDEITKDDLSKLFDFDVQDTIAPKEFDKNRWRFVTVKDGIATVTDGRLGGTVPLKDEPDLSWLCPSCLSFGPWNGAQCLTCGRMSDPFD